MLSDFHHSEPKNNTFSPSWLAVRVKSWKRRKANRQFYSDSLSEYFGLHCAFSCSHDTSRCVFLDCTQLCSSIETIATGVVLFHRFYMCSSFTEFQHRVRALPVQWLLCVLMLSACLDAFLKAAFCRLWSLSLLVHNYIFSVGRFAFVSMWCWNCLDMFMGVLVPSPVIYVMFSGSA